MEAIKYREAAPLQLSLVQEKSEDAYNYINDQIDIDKKNLNILATTTRFNVEVLYGDEISNIVNLKRVNDTRFVNKFFETVNAKLGSEGIYIGCFESCEQRKERVKNKHELFAAPFLWGDFIWKRVMPKLWITKKIYFGLTRGYNRILSTSEVLGRLISCGFKIKDYKQIKGLTYFTAKKISSPLFDLSPTYGPLIRLKRVGLNGNIIKVYKLRTMHPYAEYLQEYIYLQNDLQDGGKFKNDFRITLWGKTFRKLWLDELPMLYNWLRRDLKLVGVRPLSEHYYELYPKSLHERRIKYKPGLVPPFYADMPTAFDEIIESEIKYLDQYDKNPFLTDFKYFFKAFYNICFKNARSK